MYISSGSSTVALSKKLSMVSFEKAFELVFKCPTCGKPMMHCEDREKMINALEQKVEQLRKELDE